MTLTSNLPAQLPPEAWLGFKVNWVTGAVMVRVCMDCDSKAEAEAMAQEMGCMVSHGLCAQHYAVRIAEITGEKSA